MCAYIKQFLYILFLNSLACIKHLPGLSTQDYSENLYFYHCQMSDALFKTLMGYCLSRQIEVGSGVQVENSF